MFPDFPYIFPSFPHIFRYVSDMFPDFPYIFPSFPHIFRYVSDMFPDFPYIFPSFPHIFRYVSNMSWGTFDLRGAAVGREGGLAHGGHLDASRVGAGLRGENRHGGWYIMVNHGLTNG